MHQLCDLHADTEYHKDVIAICNAFTERMSGKQVMCERKKQEKLLEQQNEVWSIIHRYNIIFCD